MNNKKNFITALILQIVTMISGLILPRLTISILGSEINGLSSSITQFLSFITLLEGGLGAVILSELYGPIERQDTEYIQQILYSSQSFFKKLAFIFLIYTFFLSVIYPIYFIKSFEFFFVFSLIWILSITTLIQYIFSITNRLLLQAIQKIYIVNITAVCITVVNLILTIIVLYIFPKIHIIKLISVFVFLLQPFLYNKVINKHYRFKNILKIKTKIKLKNQWSGFAQNLAYFINMNTDIAVLTIFTDLLEVSVYSIYMLAVVALRAIVISLTNSYQSALGKYYAEGDFNNLKKKFYKFEKSFWILGIILFSTCLLLINPFVKLYTMGIHDVSYYQPIFALIIVIANMVYCIKEPYRLLILAAGKFKETNFGAIMEASINLFISLVLVKKMGLIGIAIGTLVATIYQLIYYIFFLKHEIIFVSYFKYLHLFLTLFIMLFLNIFIYLKNVFIINSIIKFIIYGSLILIIEIIVTFLIYKLLYDINNKIILKREGVL